MDRKLRAFIYCRVATSDQADNFALNAQSARLHQQAEREQFNIVGEVKACEYGTALDRPGWQTAVRLATEQNADIILVAKCTCVARGTFMLTQAIHDLNQRGIQLHAGDEMISLRMLWPYFEGLGTHI